MLWKGRPGSQDKKIDHKPPLSSRSKTVLITKGIGTVSLEVLAVWKLDCANRAAGTEAEGAKRYSARTKRPSGGMKERDLSRTQRWSLI